MGKIDDARAAGYSEEEIQSYLAPRVREAQEAGYSPEEIGKHLGVKPIDYAAANNALAKRVQAEITKGKEGGNKKTAIQQLGQFVLDATSPHARLEAALNLATGALAGGPAYLLGGLFGVAKHYIYDSDADPKEIAKSFAETMTYVPRSDAGKRLTSAIGVTQVPLQTLVEWSESAGKTVADVTGSPVAAAITEGTIQGLPGFLVPSFGRAMKGKVPTNSDFHIAASDLTHREPRIADPAFAEAAVNEAQARSQRGVEPQVVPSKGAAESIETFAERTGTEVGGISHLQGIVAQLTETYIKHGPEAGRMRLEEMAERAPESSGFSKEVATKDFVDELHKELANRAADYHRRQKERVEATKMLEAKLQDIYEKTGVDPQTLKAEALENPVVMAEVMSNNRLPFGGKEPPAGPPPGDRPPGSPPAPGTPEAAQAAILARVSLDEAPTKGFSLSEFYTAVKDDLYPIAELEKALTQGVPLAAAESPYKLARLVRGAAGKATQFLDFGAFDFSTYKNTGPGLKAILKPVHKDLDGFRAYLVAKRAEELHGRGIETGIPSVEAKVVIANGKKYEAVAKQLYEFQNSLVRYMKDSGLLSEESYAAMLEVNKDYVPFHRLFEDKPSATGGTGPGMSTRNPLHAIKGSERIVLDPLEAVIKNTYIYVALAEKNAVGRAFGDLVAADPAAAAALGVKAVEQPIRKIQLEEREIRALFDEFVTTARKTTTKREQTGTRTSSGEAVPESKIFQNNKARVEEALTARGFSPAEAETMIRRLQFAADKGGASIETFVREVTNTETVPVLDIRLPSNVATIFRTDALRPAPNQIRYFEDGKAKVLEVPPEVGEAFNVVDRQSAGMLLKILSFPAKTLRAGAISTPDFMARNVIRDQLTAFTFSQNGYIPVWDMLRGAMSIAKRDTEFQNWLKSGGPNSTMVALDRNYLQQHLIELNTHAGLLSRSWNVVHSPIEVLRITSELMENATRLGDFKRANATTKAEIQAAGFGSREVTLDFQRIGAQTRGLNMIAAFMNAGVEGLDRTVRAFKDNPVGASAKVAAGITMPSVLLWYANNSTPERQKRWREIPNWQRDLFWIAMTDEHTYRVPKPFEMGVIFGSSAERMLDQFAADKPEAMAGFLKSVGEMATANVIPTGAVPLLEQTTNYSLFRGQALIPRRLEGLLPEYQYTEYTTELSRAVGRVVGAFPGLQDKSIASPVVIDNYIRGWTGGLGTYVMQALDAGLRKAKVLPDPPKPIATLADLPVVKAFTVRYPSASAQSVQDFYEKHNARKTVYDTFMYLAKTGDAEAAKKAAKIDPAAFARMDGIKESLAMLNSSIRMVYRNPDMSPSDKRQLIDTMYFQMIELARAGNKAMADADAALE